MGHRLPFHKGKCKNLHGHSYRAIVSFNGIPDENGIVIDFYDMKQIVNPLLEELDHAFVVQKDDEEVISLLTKMNSKIRVLDFHSTAENLCDFLLNGIAAKCPQNIKSLTVRLYETDDAYAENSLTIG